MIEKPRHHFSIQLSTVIWNVLPVPGKPWVVVEERDETNRKVSFCAIDYQKKEIVWRNSSLPELWWINLVRVTPSQVVLKIFENTSNPDVTRLLTLSVADGKPLNQPIEIEGEHTNELIQPFQYLAGEHDFETVKQFLEGRTQKLPLLGVEYLEHSGFIFISFYCGNPGSFTNVLTCFTRAGNIVWQEEIGTNLKGIGVNTFFVVSDHLFFVKNKSELVTFRIV
ncbi:MAG: DUF4905 domain-containing protein [Cyclobacteriaceae bacterium]